MTKLSVIPCMLGLAVVIAPGALADTSQTEPSATAQAAEAEPATLDTTAVPEPAEAESDQRRLQTITVTANRREQSLQEVPISITAMNADMLEAAGISNPRTLTQIAPGVNFTQTGSNYQPVIRGISSGAVGAADESNVAMYIDGVYVADMTSTAHDLLEVDRIEVIRGPQGTLFGRNATGGLINIITRDPSHTTSGSVTGTIGRFSERSIRAYATTGISDKIAVDVAGYYYNDDGYIEDLLRGGTENSKRAWAVRGKALYEPNDRTRMVFSIGRSDDSDPVNQDFFVVDGQSVARSIDPDVILAPGPWNSAVNVHRFIKKWSDRADFQTRFTFDNFNIETTSGYQHSSLDFTADSESSPLDVQMSQGRQLTMTYSNELRILSNGEGKLDWIVGAFQFDNKGKGVTRIRASATTAPFFFIQPRAETSSLAAFAEGTYHITDWLHLTAGTRYTYEERNFRQVLSGVELFDAKVDFSEWTPRAVVRWDISDATNVYASYNRGFKSGTFNIFGVSPIPVNPEILDAFEVGIKSDPTSWLRLNASAFHYTYDDLQVSARDPATGSYTLQNAASAEIDGGELELTALATDALTFRLALSLLDAKYTSFPGAPNFIPLPTGGNQQVAVDASGSKLIRAPDMTINFGASYIQPLEAGSSIGGSVNVFYSDRVYWDTANTISQEPYTLISGELFWEPREDLRLALWGTNLTNEEVKRQLNQSGTGLLAVNEPPLRYGLRIRKTF